MSFPNIADVTVDQNSIEIPTSEPFSLNKKDVGEKTSSGLFTIIPEELRKQLNDLYFKNEYSQLLELLEYVIPKCVDDYEFFFLAGSCCKHLNKLKEAMSYFQKALEIEPYNYAVNLEVAKLFKKAELFELAEKTFCVCSDLDPTRIEPLLERGKLLYEDKKFFAANTLLKKVIALQPEHEIAWDYVIRCNIELADYRTAHEIIKKRLSQKVISRKAFLQLNHANLLTTSCELGLMSTLDDSIKHVEEYIATSNDSLVEVAEPRFNLSTTYLRIGSTEKGWEHYFHRFDKINFPSHRRQFMKPRVTDISSIKNKRVLLWREQGVGDEIMAYGLLEKFINQTGSNVIVEADERLVECINRSIPNVSARPCNFDLQTLYSPLEDFDFHMPLMDILVFLNIDKTVQTWIEPWMRFDNIEAEIWKDKIASKGLKIGFAFNSHHQTPKRIKHKHLELSFFENLINDSDNTWVNLDYTFTDEMKKSLKREVNEKIYFPDLDLKKDLRQTATLLSTLDVLISPYMAVRALAGAVGLPSISFVRGTPHHFDLGTSLDEQDIFCSPMIPLSKAMQFKDEMDNFQFESELSNFFQSQIHELEKQKNIKK